MTTDSLLQSFTQEVGEFFAQPNAYRSVLILILSIVIAYWLSRFLARAIVYIAQKVAVRTDNETRDEKIIMYRQVETYLSVTTAVMRVIVVAVVAYITWRIISPEGSAAVGGSGAAAIGASAVFIVIASATVGLLLRDITAGATMIFEKWFTIGDFIKVEPFIDVSGVVERMTLRSTKLRSLSGEIIWLHNQQIQGVHVTPRGMRTLAVDIFVQDVDAARPEIEKITRAVPTGSMLLASPLKITTVEKWSDDLWRITVTGATAPGREWLIEQFFLNAVKALDEGRKKSEKLLAYEPIARYADPVASKRFKRAVRIKRDK